MDYKSKLRSHSVERDATKHQQQKKNQTKELKKDNKHTKVSKADKKNQKKAYRKQRKKVIQNKVEVKKPTKKQKKANKPKHKKNVAKKEISKQPKEIKNAAQIKAKNFICGCGKQYVRYAMLHKHIVNKHEGKQPEGTIIPEDKKIFVNSNKQPKPLAITTNTTKDQNVNLKQQDKKIISTLQEFLGQAAKNNTEQLTGELKQNPQQNKMLTMFQIPDQNKFQAKQSKMQKEKFGNVLMISDDSELMPDLDNKVKDDKQQQKSLILITSDDDNNIYKDKVLFSQGQSENQINNKKNEVIKQVVNEYLNKELGISNNQKRMEIEVIKIQDKKQIDQNLSLINNENNQQSNEEKLIPLSFQATQNRSNKEIKSINNDFLKQDSLNIQSEFIIKIKDKKEIEIEPEIKQQKQSKTGKFSKEMKILSRFQWIRFSKEKKEANFFEQFQIKNQHEELNLDALGILNNIANNKDNDEQLEDNYNNTVGFDQIAKTIENRLNLYGKLNLKNAAKKTGALKKESKLSNYYDLDDSWLVEDEESFFYDKFNILESRYEDFHVFRGNLNQFVDSDLYKSRCEELGYVKQQNEEQEKKKAKEERQRKKELKLRLEKKVKSQPHAPALHLFKDQGPKTNSNQNVRSKQIQSMNIDIRDTLQTITEQPITIVTSNSNNEFSGFQQHQQNEFGFQQKLEIFGNFDKDGKLQLQDNDINNEMQSMKHPSNSFKRKHHKITDFSNCLELLQKQKPQKMKTQPKI